MLSLRGVWAESGRDYERCTGTRLTRQGGTLRPSTRATPRELPPVASDNAQLRLCARCRRLARSGKPANVVTGAIARELAGFIWAIARCVPPAAG